MQQVCVEHIFLEISSINSILEKLFLVRHAQIVQDPFA